MVDPTPTGPVATGSIALSFVCLGNICRSPTAEAAMAHVARVAGCSDRLVLDSAGTAGWHQGDPPDPRSVAAAARRGIVMEHRGRRFTAADFDRFDHILAMDHDNARDLRRLAPSPGHAARVTLLRRWDPAAVGGDPHGFDHAVPDPYYGGEADFDRVLDLVLPACEGLLAHLRTTHGW